MRKNKHKRKRIFRIFIIIVCLLCAFYYNASYLVKHNDNKNPCALYVGYLTTPEKYAERELLRNYHKKFNNIKYNFFMAINEKNVLTIKERQINDDIIFMNDVVVYSNITLKLIHLIQNAKKEQCRYTMKTDTDSFVQFNNIIEHVELICVPLNTCNKVVYGNWNIEAKVYDDPMNKWYDSLYPTDVYLPYPQGSGYLFGNQILNDLSTLNKNDLTIYPNEDATLGLWISLYQHFKINSYAIYTFKSLYHFNVSLPCNFYFEIFHQATQFEIKQLYNRYMKCVE